MAQAHPEVGVLLDALGSEVVYGRTHLRLWFWLDTFLVGNREVAGVAPGFFNLTLRANAREAFLHLSKLLDTRRGTANLRRLLKAAGDNEGKFQRLSAQEVRETLLPKEKATLRSIRLEAKPVIVLRNRILAHLDMRVLAEEGAGLGRLVVLESDTKISYDKMDDLFKRAGEMLNRISGAYRASSRVMDPLTGWDDFIGLLRLVEQSRKKGFLSH